MFLRYMARSDRNRFAFHKIDLNGDIGRLLTLLDAERPQYLINFATQSEIGPS